GADAEVDRRARVEMRDRMHAERKRDVRAVLRGGADQRPRALEGHEVRLHVLGRARIKQRPAGGAARAPVLDHPGARLDAELVVEALGRNLAQVLLGQHRNAPPDLWIIQPHEVDGRHAPLPERRLQRAFDRDALALVLDTLDVLLRARPAEIAHRTFSSRSSSPPRIARFPRSVMREMFRWIGSLFVQKRWKIAVAVMVKTIRQITPTAGCQSTA